MADNSQILPNGFGYPFVWITNKKGESIELDDPYKKKININQLVTSFSYKYDEENDDECVIDFGIVNVSQLENDTFTTDTVLNVQWGYILPKGQLVKGVVRKVAVRDIETQYHSDKICIKLKCTDMVSYIRNQKLNRSSTRDNLSEFIREIITGEYQATTTVKGGIAVLVPKDKQIDPDKEFVIEGVGIAGMKAVKKKDVVIKGNGKAIMQEIEDKLAKQVKGPAYVNGRDDVLDITIRDFNQAPYKGFTFAGNTGELISFTPSTQVVKLDKDEAESVQVNPETKEIETTKAVKVQDSGEVPEGLTKLDLKRIVGKVKTGFEYNQENLTNQLPMDSIVVEKTWRSTSGYANTNVDLTDNTRVAKQREIIETKHIYATKDVLTLPYTEAEIRKVYLENYIEKKLQRKYEAMAEVIGDPSLISSRVYSINGVRPFDSGNWYCISAEHNINPGQGYICKLELIKKPKLLATIIEERTENQKGEYKSQYQENDIFFQNNSTASSSMGLNADEINDRVAEQKRAEDESRKLNDLVLKPKLQFTDNPIINSEDV